MSVGIVGYGVYVPRYRIKRSDIGIAWGAGGRGEISVANHDEDVVTMSVEACENALEQCGLEPTKIDGMYFGSVSQPYLEHSSLGIIAQALGVGDNIEMVDFGSSTRASAAALKSCVDAISAGRLNYGLVVAADHRAGRPGSDQELNFGTAATAFVLGKHDVIAKIEGSACCSSCFMETWRGVSDKYVNLVEPRYSREWGYEKHVKEAGKMLMNELGLSADNFQHIVLQYPSDVRRLNTVMRELGFQPQAGEKAALVQEIGDCGNASVPLGIASVLDEAQPDDMVMAVSYGSGMADAIGLRVENKITEARRDGKSVKFYLDSKEYMDYMTLLKFKNELQDPGEATMMFTYPDSPFWNRSGREIYQLIGNKCTKCGYINFPPSQRLICIRCGNTRFESVILARRGRVHSYNYDVYAAPPLRRPVVTLILEMEDGSIMRVLGTEIKPEDISIGMPVELVFRRISVEKGISVYSRTYAKRPR